MVARDGKILLPEYRSRVGQLDPVGAHRALSAGVVRRDSSDLPWSMFGEKDLPVPRHTREG